MAQANDGQPEEKHKRVNERQELPSTIPEIEQQVNCFLAKFAATFNGKAFCYPLLLGQDAIVAETVDNVFDDLQDRIGPTPEEDHHLVVVVDSIGGDIDAAYNLALLFQLYGTAKLTFVVPRSAKSAATLLVCGGNSVMMMPVAELGPLDPQITQVNPLEQRLERFSPLHVESTLELIRNEFNEGNKELAQGLLERLQFPITLGSFKKSLEIGKQYAAKLLASRMLKGADAVATEIAHKLVEDYADHGFCININEAEALGLVVTSPSEQQLKLIWSIHKLAVKKAELQAIQREKEMKDQIKELPSELIEQLPPGIVNNKPSLGS